MFRIFEELGIDLTFGVRTGVYTEISSETIIYQRWYFQSSIKLSEYTKCDVCKSEAHNVDVPPWFS